MLCKRYLISGQVRGVFYRSSAQHQANLHGLRGWVRNLRDGRVELLACGDETDLIEMEKWLQIGPEDAKVSNIEPIEETPEAIPDTFEVRPTSSL
ncbi:MAG: acylphosphatase [Gammaproteobacteria bacterium]|jgi:acylphosphatase|nr:acylphosphatase [Gammaproteobacteria bacterium]